MKNDQSPYCKCLYHSANAFARQMQRMADEAFSTTGLSSSHAFLLMSVNAKPGIQPKELVGDLQLTASTITRLIEKMENRGFIERRSNGKATEVYPTEKSVAINEQLKQCWQNLYHNYSAKIGEGDAVQLTDMISDAGQLIGS